MLQVSPSTLGNFFFLDCERMLRYSATPEEQREKEGIPEGSFQKSMVTEEIIQRGKTWEEKVVREKLKGKVLIGGDPQKPFGEQLLPYREVVTLLNAPPEDELYLYQSHLRPSEAFYRRYAIPSSEIVFSPCRPDLIYLKKGKDDRWIARITDIKASQKTKFSHCIQTALYMLILRDVLRSEGIERCEVDDENCDIWLLDEEAPEPFETKRILDPLETFLSERLPKILRQPAHQARWSLCKHCEWCEYLEHCREEADSRQDISLLPYLPKEAKFFLGSLERPVTTLSEAADFFEQEESVKHCRTCGALAGHRDRLMIEINCMLSREKNEKGQWRAGEAIPYGRSSIALPKGQNIGIVFTLQQDPITGNIFAAAIHAQGGKEIHGQDKPWCMIAQSPEKSDCDQVLSGFLERLSQIMGAVHEYNLGEDDWGKQKSLQCYVYDQEEKNLLDEMLSNALENPELAEKALSLFFYFQSERLADASWHAANEIPFPVIVVVDVIRELMALPVPVAYKLTTVSLALRPSMYASVYSPKSEYSFAYSNKLRTDPIFQAWKGEERETLDTVLQEVRYELEKRLKATFSVLAGIREKAGECLFAYPPKFFMPQKLPFRHPVLSKLAFLTRYEEVLEYLQIHFSRASSLAQRLESGDAFRIRVRREIKKGRWEAALAPESSHLIPEGSGYLEWLLSTDDNAGYREQIGFPDFWYREYQWVPRKCNLCFASIEKVSTNDGKRLILEIKSGANSPMLMKDSFYLLHRRYTDFISKRVLRNLEKEDQTEDSLFLSLLDDPHRALEKRNRPRGLKQDRKMDEFLGPFGFTESQRKAFLRICDSSHQVIWGPPGSGKTHFLGLSILALAAFAEKEKKRVRVLVTAFTHAAIENCLKVVEKLSRMNPDRVPPVQIVKLGGWRGQDCPPNIGIAEALAPISECHQVVGCTLFAIGNENCVPPDQTFDVVVIDEASQVKVSESAMAISRVEPRNGRLIVAGDDRQLGPIVHGTYPRTEEAGMPLFGSIFECLRDRDKESESYTSQLTECFRMNDVLCSFPAFSIYGQGFLPANESVASRRIGLMQSSVSLGPDSPVVASVGPLSGDSLSAGNAASLVKEESVPYRGKVRLLEGKSKVRILPHDSHRQGMEWIDWVLSPDHPLTLLILEGVSSLAENPMEAGLVADIAMGLRNRLLQDGRIYPNDETFWQKGLFIVSPHHVQIQAIYQELSKRKEWEYPPFIDTVNKMQGQESDCVLISYGVSDMNYALQEGEFIYSLNRLNVAITRARAKAVVCIPSPLLTPPLSAFGRPELLEGLDFMLKLRRMLLSQGERAKFIVRHAGEKAGLTALRMK